MKITVISDTHMPRKAKTLPTRVIKSIERTDALIHAGDFTSPNLLYYLEALTHVEAVAGNNDGYEIILHLGTKKIVEMNGYRIGIIHGEGIHSTTIQRVKQAFANDRVDIVIFGHSHQAYNKWEDGVLYFNPGSPTDKRRSPKYSYGEITLGDKIKAEIFYF
ncbi:hypothetical protein BHF71_09885 [Vulcanibacillus modesticaldus]|uniref:Phosphoesterase n=1 Tax=Vulcanibacillus modesticaldus TaxID=337097 RepID=A0A1D2YTG9_9BACI|nr:metallophosphoesterase [Vulcanibacillus modesticaldus]OEF98990.1 hypothetical protein BHF71_09885 [Vulcanibacillus modesticaldus]